MTKTLLEKAECQAFADWLQWKSNSGNLEFSHIAHSTWTPSKTQKITNRLLGLRPGVPDYLIVCPPHIIFVEMKRLKKGVISPHQERWLKLINQCGSNVHGKVCYGADEAIKFVEKIIKEK